MAFAINAKLIPVHTVNSPKVQHKRKAKNILREEIKLN
jgi:hypothetical protein